MCVSKLPHRTSNSPCAVRILRYNRGATTVYTELEEMHLRLNFPAGITGVGEKKPIFRSSPGVLKISRTSPFIRLVTLPDASSAQPAPLEPLSRCLPPLRKWTREYSRLFPSSQTRAQGYRLGDNNNPYETALGITALDRHLRTTLKGEYLKKIKKTTITASFNYRLEITTHPRDPAKCGHRNSY